MSKQKYTIKQLQWEESIDMYGNILYQSSTNVCDYEISFNTWHNKYFGRWIINEEYQDIGGLKGDTVEGFKARAQAHYESLVKRELDEFVSNE